MSGEVSSSRITELFEAESKQALTDLALAWRERIRRTEVQQDRPFPSNMGHSFQSCVHEPIEVPAGGEGEG